jgi:hypothetical protein
MLSALVDQNVVKSLKSDLAQILDELRISDSLRIEEEE